MTQANISIHATDNDFTPSRALPFGLTWSMLGLTMILVIAATLRLVDAATFADGNTYYTAAVENMLQSPSNFFYAVADAGGVTVDKPPVALWIQATFAAVLGVSGFSVTLPSIIAGTLSVLILYHIVKKQFGTSAGLISALVLAVTPIAVAVDRTNNLDSILIFFLLLATWAFVRAVETGKWRHLLLGAMLVGVAFNVKMLQAYLIVPALFAAYFFAAKVPWRKKVVQLGVTAVVLLAVSLSWAIIVDLTPGDQRPYIGGSESNSVIELALGYNGLNRLLGNDGPSLTGNSDGGQNGGGQNGANQARTQNNGQGQNAGDQSNANAQAPGSDGDGRGNGPDGSAEIGSQGATRLFETALANELAWLLPFGLLGIGVLIVRRRPTLPIQREHQAVILWGGWLVTGVVFFSVSSFFHAYYLATLAPALAALVGITTMTLFDLIQEKRNTGYTLTGTLLVITVTAQLYFVTLYDVSPLTYGLPLAIAGSALMLALMYDTWHAKSTWSKAAFVAVLIAVPAMWSISTATNTTGILALPAAYAGETANAPNQRANTGSAYDDLVAEIEASGNETTYDLVVDSSMVGGNIVLNTDLNVLYLGGFNGLDIIYTAESFAEMVESGEIGYVMSGSNVEISNYVSATCTLVEGVSLPSGRPGGGSLSGDDAQNGRPSPGSPPRDDDGPGRFGGASELYNCGG